MIRTVNDVTHCGWVVQGHKFMALCDEGAGKRLRNVTSHQNPQL